MLTGSSFWHYFAYHLPILTYLLIFLTLFMFLTLTLAAVCESKGLSPQLLIVLPIPRLVCISILFKQRMIRLPCLVVYVKFQFLYTTKTTKLDCTRGAPFNEQTSTNTFEGQNLTGT